MIDALALAAIARAVDLGGDVDGASAALGRADPLLRAAARRRVRAAHAEALLMTRVKHADGGLHALRLAYLHLGRALPEPSERDDVAAVEAAFTAARARRSGGGGGLWWASAALVAAMIGGGAATWAAFGWVEARSASPPAPVAERAGPAPRGAFATGGVPAPLPGDEILRRVLSREVPDYLIALDRWADAKRGGGEVEVAKLEAELGAARDRALSAEARAALGEGPARALEVLLGAARAAAEAAPGAAGDRADEAVAEASGVLDDELAAAGAGYFVDGDVIQDGSGKRLPLVYAFAVERVHLFRATDASVRALHLRRVDRLNWSHTLLGFTRPHLRAAAVLLDQLDEQVLTLIAPGLAEGAATRLFDPEAGATLGEEVARVEARAGALAREEYGAWPGLDASTATALGRALGRRRAIVEDLEKRAAERGLSLIVPGKLRLPEGFTRSVEPIARRPEITELGEIDAALGDEAHARAFAALREALAASVERHEVQHRLDARRPPRMPEALAARTGPLLHEGRERRHAAAARAELSAYLAELARDGRTPRVGLSMVARFLFDRRLHGTAECYAALTIFEELSRALDVRDEAPLLAQRTIDRRAASRVYLALAAAPPDRLRAAAKASWETLFGAKLADLTEGP